MKRTGYEYEVKPVIELSRAEVDALIKLAELHYDFKCKSYAKEGGLLFRYRSLFKNGYDEGKGVISVTIGLRDVDTLCKILEGAALFKILAGAPSDTPKEVKALWLAMSQLLQEGAAEQARLNPDG